MLLLRRGPLYRPCAARRRPRSRAPRRIAPKAMQVAFSKYHGLGNDFILVDSRGAGKPVVTPQEATKLCDRNFGIGADGVIFALPGSNGSHFAMRIYNSDGSEPEMCGNGIRCLAKFVSEIDQSAETHYKIDTLAGLIQPELLPDGQVCVDMGLPVLTAADIPTTLPSDPGTGQVVGQEMQIEDDTYTVTAVSMGNPHACVYSKNGRPIKVAEIPLHKVGPRFEHHASFPARVNTEFVEILNPGHVKMVVWERGAGPTLACGTGACALVVAGILEKRLERRCQVDLPGGPLLIEWRLADGHVYMTGPAERVFTGVVQLSSAT